MLRFLLTNWKSSQPHWEFQSLWKTPMKTVHFEVRFFKILISAKQRRGQASFIDLKTCFLAFLEEKFRFYWLIPKNNLCQSTWAISWPWVCGLARFFIFPCFSTMFGHATDWTFVYGRRCIWKLETFREIHKQFCTPFGIALHAEGGLGKALKNHKFQPYYTIVMGPSTSTAGCTIAMTESVGCFLNLLAVTVTGPFCRMLMRFITSIQSLRDLWKQSRAKLMMQVFQNRLFLFFLWFFLASPVSLLSFCKVQLNPRPYVSSLAFQSAAQLGVDNANKVKLDQSAGCYAWAKDQWGCFCWNTFPMSTRLHIELSKRIKEKCLWIAYILHWRHYNYIYTYLFSASHVLHLPSDYHNEGSISWCEPARAMLLRLW